MPMDWRREYRDIRRAPLAIQFGSAAAEPILDPDNTEPSTLEVGGNPRQRHYLSNRRPRPSQGASFCLVLCLALPRSRRSAS